MNFFEKSVKGASDGFLKEFWEFLSDFGNTSEFYVAEMGYVLAKSVNFKKAFFIYW